MLAPWNKFVEKELTTGVSTKPATTDGSAPSVPDTTTITSAALTAAPMNPAYAVHTVEYMLTCHSLRQCAQGYSWQATSILVSRLDSTMNVG